MHKLLKYIPNRHVIHLDLKGVPPKVSYLRSVFPVFRATCATHLLVEWEDIFPFCAELKSMSALNACAKQDVKVILNRAKEIGLEASKFGAHNSSRSIMRV